MQSIPSADHFEQPPPILTEVEVDELLCKVTFITILRVATRLKKPPLGG